MRAPTLVLGPALRIEYRVIVVPVMRSPESEEALVAAALLAAERRSTVAIVHVLEVPMELPLTTQLPERGARGRLTCSTTRGPWWRATGSARSPGWSAPAAAGPAIVANVVSRDAQLVVLGATRRGIGRRAPSSGTPPGTC